MNFKSVAQLAIKNLMNNKLRSALTMIGIIAGVASVISIVSVMNSMKMDIMNSFDKMYNTQISVEIYDYSQEPVSMDEINCFLANNSDILCLFSPVLSYGSVETKINGCEDTNEILGTDSTYSTILSLKFKGGRFMMPYEIEHKLNVCVIGSYVKDKYFARNSAIGETIILKNSVYRIIGVLDERDGGQEWSKDNTIIIPYTTINRLNEDVDSEYLFSAISKEKAREGKKIISDYFLKQYKSEKSYYITAMIDEIEFATSTINTLSLVLIGVAAIALIVGGIGIMNIMLISVNERTEEIGIRMAVGATPNDILHQFITESAIISCIGGCAGVVLGVLLSMLIIKFMSLNICISIISIVISILTATLTGVIFGYFPAQKASKLLPVDALKK